MRPESEVRPYAWYVLGVLTIVYVFNFVDRQLITILAPELKRDLGISDSDFGFLYGTAFGVFYAVFGIPLGKLADRWLRVPLIALGLALWSAMTALSGLSRNFAQLAAARVGVGIGEATLAPCAYSVLSDYFPPNRRATALGIYSAGLYLGAGISLFLGSSIASAWNDAFAGERAPFGLAGWQVAFLAVGIPGLVISAWVASLREPPRGTLDGPDARVGVPAEASPWPDFAREVADIVPPFTLAAAARRGTAALLANLAIAVAIAAGAGLLAVLTGDRAQWIAFGLGCYAIASWTCAARVRAPGLFGALFRTRSFLGVTLGYALVSFLGYANLAFAPLYAIEELGADPAKAGFMLGGLGALAGVLGIVAGGIISDGVSRDGIHARRILVIAAAAFLMMAGHATMFTAETLEFYYPAVFVTTIFMSAALGGAAGAIVNIVAPDLRGVATAVFLLGTNMIGLALGPYTAGALSERFADLGTGMLALLAVSPLALLALFAAVSDMPKMAGNQGGEA